MAADYARVKQETQRVLEKLEELSASQGNKVLAAYLEEQQQKLAGDKFNLVVLGQFKRGKTTFINALLGDEVLPTSVVPLTSIITLREKNIPAQPCWKFISNWSRLSGLKRTWPNCKM